jgi:branched-chain amino acid transport system substrate-binding protein
VAQWDAAADSWSLITDYIQSDQDVLAPLVTEDAQAFAAESGIEPSC